MRRLLALALVVVLSGCATAIVRPRADEVVLGTTTTTQDSGLLDALLPAFEEDTRVHVKAVVGGSGEVIAKARRGDVDALLSHSPAAELALVASGDGAYRRPVMSNRFFLVGPAWDPAGVAQGPDAGGAFARIHENRSSVRFASRGDGSGTDVKEKAIWAGAGLDAHAFDSSWYRQTGSGQSQTLAVADQQDAYALSDEATWAQLRAHGQLTHLRVLFQDDAAFHNPYAVVPVNATKHPGVRQDLAERFADWLVGEKGQGVIAGYRVGGSQVFFPEGRPGA